MDHRFVAPETLYRMLDKAHAEGVAVLGVANHPSKPAILGAHVSSSRVGELPYAVWLYGAGSGCDCPGYEKHGYCKHWALVLDRAGLLPELADEPVETPTREEYLASLTIQDLYEEEPLTREELAELMADEPAPWEGPADLVAGGYQPRNARKAAALVDLSQRQAASVDPSPVRGKRVRKAAA